MDTRWHRAMVAEALAGNRFASDFLRRFGGYNREPKHTVRSRLDVLRERLNLATNPGRVRQRIAEAEVQR